MQPAARVGDMHTCPMATPATPPVPHVGGPVLPPGGVTVLIGGMPAARMGDMCTCVGPPDVIVQGALNVLICGQPAARMGDMTAHGGVISVGCPTVLIGMAAGGGAGSPTMVAAGGGAGGPGTPAGSSTDAFDPDHLASQVGQGVEGEDSAELREAMNTLYENRDNPNDPAVASALETVARIRSRPLNEIQNDWDKFQGLLADQRRIGAANGKSEVEALATNDEWFKIDDHGEFMGSRSQLRSGAKVGEVLGVDPVFGSLLNPTGGLVGPGNNAFDLNDSAVGHHGAVHDAAGYLYNYHDTGPGYDYLGTDGRDTSDPLSGQRNGIGFHREALSNAPGGDPRSRGQRAADATTHGAANAGVPVRDGVAAGANAVGNAASATADAVSNAYDNATNAVSSAWDSLF